LKISINYRVHIPGMEGNMNTLYG